MLRWTLKLSLLASLALLGNLWADDFSEKESAVVQPLASAFKSSLERHNAAGKFAKHRAFVASLLAESQGTKSFKDKTGNCRSETVAYLVEHPEAAMAWAELSTSKFMEVARQTEVASGLAQLMSSISRSETGFFELNPTKTENTQADLEAFDKLLAGLESAKTPEVMELVKQLLAWSTREFADAIGTLNAEELATLRSSLYPKTTGDLNFGHTFADKREGRIVADLLDKFDRSALSRSAIVIGGFSDPKIIAALGRIERSSDVQQVKGVVGELYQRIETPHGIILVGGPEANEYNLDELADVAAVIDLGGNDTYLEGIATEKRPVLVVIDLAGDDTYRGTQPGIQGSGILGVSLLMDQAGNDTYSAGDVAQGSALGGVGILIDNAGNDSYIGDRRVQGQATGGFGLLLDRAGDDKYRAALLAQGVGGPLGVGVLLDLDGADHYFAGGKYPGGYDDTPGFGGWSQGVGVGPRGIANGGIGMILDGGGDDIYEADYFSHGGGYWFAAGVARDFGGNDQRVGATRENFDGTPRTEPRFVRWGTGYGCHYAAGFVIDDAGNDTYQADFAVIAYAWDIAVAGICDLAGDDKYITQGSGVCEAHNSGVAFLYDKSGNDVYQGGIASTTETTDYHPEGGSGNYTLLLDEAGEDQYGRDLKNGAEQLRGWGGAILIDKP